MEGNTIKTYPYGYWKLVIREIKRVKQIHSLSSYCPFFPVISYFRSLISLFSSKFRNLLTFLYLVLADNFGICPQYFSHFVKYFQYQNLFTNRCKNAINKKKSTNRVPARIWFCRHVATTHDSRIHPVHPPNEHIDFANFMFRVRIKLFRFLKANIWCSS